jgi:hypothetical protein
LTNNVRGYENLLFDRDVHRTLHDYIDDYVSEFGESRMLMTTRFFSVICIVPWTGPHHSALTEGRQSVHLHSVLE